VDQEEGRTMEAKKENSGGESANGDRFKDVVRNNTTGNTGKKPGLVTALVLHYVRCSGIRLESLGGNNAFA
jgi:hypothetical protein